MERQEIIKEFLKNGFQLHPKALDYLVERKNVNFFLEELKKSYNHHLIITLDVLKEIESKFVYSLEIVKTPKKEEKVISVSDYTNFISTKYEEIKKLLTKHLDLVNLISGNKISPKTRKFSLIAIVKEKDESEKCLVVEDFTGEQTVYFDNLEEDFKLILEDEILGLVCERKGEKIFVKKVVVPEIPLKKEINTTSEEFFCFFISDFHMDDKNFNKKSYEKFIDWINNSYFKKLYVFILGDISSKIDDVEKLFNNLPKNYHYTWLKGETDPEDCNNSIKNPSLLKVEKSINILLLHTNFPFPSYFSDISPTKLLLNFLRKRQIPHTTKQFCNQNLFLIDLVPDILAAGHFHLPSFFNYKGTTIITTGSFLTNPTFWLVNLKTRETIKIDFA
ncbi:MAG: hypothetical protein NZ942_01890 [Candidatus Aenigmarchaeota archaeon]|nr:hypothetical protein [Candidatus Aenigmarchaeota archaeon]